MVRVIIVMYTIITSPAIVGFALIIVLISVATSLGQASKDVPVSTIPGTFLERVLPFTEILNEKRNH